MIESSRAILEIEELPPFQALAELKERDFVSFVSHSSTAEVLSRMLGRKVKVNRKPLKLKEGDVAFVFQLRVRPAEGQVFYRGGTQQDCGGKQVHLLQSAGSLLKT